MFSHHFLMKCQFFLVHLKTPRFFICFQTISNRISVKIAIQMRSAGKLTSILHRCFRMVFLWNFKIFMFMGKHWSFWYILEQFLTNFRCKLWHRCVSQGNLPSFCIGALTRCCSSKCNDPRVYEKRRCYRRVSRHNRHGGHVYAKSQGFWDCFQGVVAIAFVNFFCILWPRGMHVFTSMCTNM